MVHLQDITKKETIDYGWIKAIVQKLSKLSSDPDRKGGVLVIVDPEAPALFSQNFGEVAPAKIGKYIFCAHEKAIRLFGNSDLRSILSENPESYAYGGGIRGQSGRLTSFSGFEWTLDEALSVVVDAFITTRERGISIIDEPEKFNQECLQIVDEFIGAAQVSDNPLIKGAAIQAFTFT